MVFSFFYCMYICLMSEFQIGDAIKQFINKSRLKNGIRCVQIETIWEKLMGNTIAKYTEKIEIKNETLFIHTTIGPLKQELLYQKELIIKRINEAFGEAIIKSVIIQ